MNWNQNPKTFEKRHIKRGQIRKVNQKERTLLLLFGYMYQCRHHFGQMSLVFLEKERLLLPITCNYLRAISSAKQYVIMT